MKSPLTHTIRQVKENALDFFNEKGSPSLLFHDYKRALEVDQLIMDIADDDEGLGATHPEVVTARLAHWFLSLGRVLDYGHHVVAGTSLVRKYLDQPALVPAVLQTMEHQGTSQSPTTDSDALLHDAQLAYWATSNFARLSPLMRMEQELLLLDGEMDSKTWEEGQLRELLSAQFHTEYGKLTLSPILHQNILEQRERVETLRRKSLRQGQREDGGGRKFRGLEEKVPERGNQTFFRSMYRNHIHLSAIADNKANMMTGINAILVSVVISIITYTHLIYDKPSLTMPVAIFLLTALVSLICSVAAASPRITKKNPKGQNPLTSRRNIAYFGNFTQMSLEEFEEAVDAVLRNDELLYGNMTRDLYFLGKVLDKKYRLLRLSYHVFLGGFVLSVLLFTYIAFT